MDAQPPQRNPTLLGNLLGASQKPIKKRFVDKASLEGVKHRPYYFNAAASTIYKVDPAKFIVLGKNNMFIAVRQFEGATYVCVRYYYFNQVSLQWYPTKFGLNLTIAEWEILTCDRMIAIVRSAILQEEELHAPEPKDTLEKEVQEPTSWPTRLKNGKYQHRHMLGMSKKAVVVDREYSSENEVLVTLAKFEDESSPLMEKFIHLKVEEWEVLLGNVSEVNNRISKIQS